MAWAACMAGSQVFIDDVTADRSSRMSISCPYRQPNVTKLIGRRFSVQMDNDPEHPAKNSPRPSQDTEMRFTDQRHLDAGNSDIGDDYGCETSGKSLTAKDFPPK